MSGEDNDKTVIGGALPGAAGSQPKPLPNLAAPRPLPGGPAGPGAGFSGSGFSGGSAGDDSRTQIGGTLPIPPQPAAPPAGGDVWGVEQFSSGAGGGPPPAAAPPIGPGPLRAAPPGGFGGSGFVGGAALPGGAVQPGLGTPFAPPPDPQPFPVAPTAAGGPVPALGEALQAMGAAGTAAFANPLVGAAADLLLLLGRLRAQQVALQVEPLMAHVARSIERFEREALQAGLPAEEVKVAQYMLCGTADDIVQNLPSAERHLWMQSPMVARFFNVRTSGVGFFQELEKAQRAPAQRANLLEFALICLSLGFEGKYRGQPSGARDLQRERNETYDSLRGVRPRAEIGLSPRWMPVVVARERRFGGVSALAIAGAAGLALAGVYMGLSLFLASESGRVTGRLLGVVPAGAMTLVRPEPPLQVVVPQEVVRPPTGQMERLSTALAPEIAADQLELDRKGDYIRLRLNNATLFASGKVDLLPEFAPLAQRLAAVLEAEPGNLKIQGFTDTDPVRRGGRFKDNFALSLARAEAVKGALAAGLSTPDRLEAEGRGESEPLGDNKTAEGKALNRRVELLLLREEIARP